MQRIASDRVARAERYRHEAEARQRQLSENHEAEVAEFRANEKARWEEIERDWKREIIPLYEAIEARTAMLAASFPPWDAAFAEAWTPATRFHSDKACRVWPRSDEDADDSGEPPPLRYRVGAVTIPLALVFPRQGCLSKTI
jgi:hypothetical protein